MSKYSNQQKMKIQKKTDKILRTRYNNKLEISKIYIIQVLDKNTYIKPINNK